MWDAHVFDEIYPLKGVRKTPRIGLVVLSSFAKPLVHFEHEIGKIRQGIQNARTLRQLLAQEVFIKMEILHILGHPQMIIQGEIKLPLEAE